LGKAAPLKGPAARKNIVEEKRNMTMRQQVNATFKIVLGLTAVLALAGAKGEGCGGAPPPPDCDIAKPDPACEDGFELDKICNQLCAVTVDPDGNTKEVCEPEVCKEICVPIDDCGPGYHAEKICGEPTDPTPELAKPNFPKVPPPGGEDCKVVCVPDETCDPKLLCGDALTCVDGQLYPSTCGPKNCDAPIGDCEPECDVSLPCLQALTCFDGVLYPTSCGPKNCDLPIGDCKS